MIAKNKKKLNKFKLLNFVKCPNCNILLIGKIYNNKAFYCCEECSNQIPKNTIDTLL